MPLIALSDISDDHRAQPRTSIMVDKVSEYTEDMERGDKFPPLIVFYDQVTHWLADGFHRFYGARGAGLKKVECYVKAGGLRDAILYSCGANAAHGLRRTNFDKRRAVAKLIEDTEWAQWSDAEIARHCCVTQPFVGKIRKEVAAFSPKTVIGEERKFKTKHGTETTMRPGLREVPKVTDAAVLSKSLHEIERHIELMGDPVAAANDFPEDQHYLFALSRLDELAAWMTDFARAWRAKMKAKAHAAVG